METVDTVLVPTDGSEGAFAGARRGIELAATTGATLHVVSVVDTRETERLPTSSSNGPLEQTDVREEGAQDAVDSVARVAREHLAGLVTTAVEWGTPAQAINDYADEHDIDLIVMGTHGRSGLQRLVLGSVAEKVLRSATVPLLLVPPSADVDDLGDPAYENVLLPTDGSEGAEAAVDVGVGLAEAYDATVHTIYSVDTSRFPAIDGTADIYDALESVGEEAIGTVRERAREAGVSVAGSLGRGPAARVILSYAEEHDVDLIVMGTHGRSGVERFLVGSVTETVVRHAEVPICCVPLSKHAD